MAATGLQLLMCAPGIAFLPVIGPPLALVVALAGLASMVSFQVLLSGACPFCESGQAIVLPMEGIRRRQLRERRTGRVLGADCTVCANRMIVQVDARVAIAAPQVVVMVK